jgi:hypothetical protein
MEAVSVSDSLFEKQSPHRNNSTRMLPFSPFPVDWDPEGSQTPTPPS